MNSSNEKQIRLALVSPGFWPVSGSTEFAATSIANSIVRAGHQAEVLTIRWEKNWPTYFDFQGVGVHRINRPLAGPWGSFRYLKHLNRLLTEIDPDGILIFGLGDEAHAVTRAFANKTPCIIRLDSHVLGATDGKPAFNSRQFSAIQAAERLIVDSQWTANRLALHASIDSSKIDVAADPIHLPGSNTSGHEPDNTDQISKGSARVAISDAHPVLMIEPDQPLVVTCAPMDGDDGMLDLVKAWSRVIRKHPRARLWIIGEGKQSRKIWDAVREKQLVYTIIMPGSFDELADVFCAADAYVHPLKSNQSCPFLNLALSQGVCCTAYANEMTQSVIRSDESGLLVDQTPAALAESLIHLLSQPETRQRLGQNAAMSMETRISQESADSFLKPFLHLSQRALGSHSQDSTSG